VDRDSSPGEPLYMDSLECETPTIASLPPALAGPDQLHIPFPGASRAVWIQGAMAETGQVGPSNALNATVRAPALFVLRCNHGMLMSHGRVVACG
jgi:hypothetical protein